MSLQLDEHVACFDLDHKTAHTRPGWRAGHCPGFDIEVRAVPWAGDAFPVQLTFTQRPAPVSAGVVDRVECALRIEEHDAATVGFYNPDVIIESASWGSG